MASTANRPGAPADSLYRLKTGMLLKQGHLVKSWKERLFILALDKLCYYEPSGLDELSDVKGVTPLGVIRLSDVTSVAATRSRCTFTICVGANPSSKSIDREFIMVAATDKERDEWLAALRRAIFSPNRAVDILRQAVDMQKDGRLCTREVEQVKAWLQGGSDGELGKAAAAVSDASQRDYACRASDACESLLIDLRAAASERELMRVLSALRRVLRDEEDDSVDHIRPPVRGGSDPHGKVLVTGAPTDDFRERLLSAAMEHIQLGREVIVDTSRTQGDGLGGGKGAAEVPSSSSSSPNVTPTVTTSSWLPLFSLRAPSTDNVRTATIDRANSRGSTINRSDSYLPGSAGSSSSSLSVYRWSGDVQEAFGLVLHQIAMRVAIAEANKPQERNCAVSSDAGGSIVPIAPPIQPATTLSASQVALDDAKSVTPLGQQDTEVVEHEEDREGLAALATPTTTAVSGMTVGSGAEPALASADAPLATICDTDSPATTCVSLTNNLEAGEALDTLLERYGLADDLRRLQRVRAATTPTRERALRSRGESQVSSRSGGTPVGSRRGTALDDTFARGIDIASEPIVREEDEEGDVGDDTVPAPTAAYLRGPTPRARAATAASVLLSEKSRADGVIGRLTSAVFVLSVVRHSDKVSAAASEGVIAGPDASMLHISPDDPDPCAALREEKPFGAIYNLGDRIGEGAYSVVYRGTHKASGEAVAVKIARKSAMTPVERRRLLEEVRIMSVLDHDHIVRLQAFHEDDEAYYIVSELCTGGELFDKIVTRNTYTEREAREVVRTIAEAVAYMHAHGIVHRDLKPENVLLSTSDDETALIRIADMGFAKFLPYGNTLRTSCGTPSYVAPEILEGKPYDAAVDMWSLGVICYILLAGYAPFHARNQTELFRSIVAGRYYFDSPYWDGVSEAAKDLIRRLLMVDSSRRITAAQVLKHRWLHGTVSAVELTSAVQQLRISQSSRREVLKRGELIKRGAIFWSWRTRTFLLTSETLEYYDSGEYADGTNPLARPKGVISLKDVDRVGLLEGTAAITVHAAAVAAMAAAAASSGAAMEGTYLFTVRVAGGREYILAANSEVDRSDWMRAMSSARAHSDLVRKALLAKEAHSDTDLVALMKLAAAWKELMTLPQAESEEPGSGTQSGTDSNALLLRVV